MIEPGKVLASYSTINAAPLDTSLKVKRLPKNNQRIVNMNPEQLTKSLKSEAKRLGFQLSGACPAVTPDGFDNFLDWLDRGYAGQMHYLKDRSAAYQHPSSVMSGVESLLMLGMMYQAGIPRETHEGTGRIASYAWGPADYHDVVHKKLKSLKKFVHAIDAGIHVRGVVDTAPLLERDFAQLAGIGWKAKNTLLINKTSGSWFFLAALLLDVQLDYDVPVQTDHCGTCTACLDACPTDAFVEPHVLDATKCISYLTIEHRTSIPKPLRPLMDDWILGCDVCQTVCPWNRKPQLAEETEFSPAEGQNPIELRSLFWLSEEQFRVRFRKTPLWRPKRRGILRNAAIALGNHPDQENLAALRHGLSDQEPLVRGSCAWAIGNHNAVASLSSLETALEHEPDDEVRHEILDAINRLTA